MQASVSFTPTSIKLPAFSAGFALQYRSSLASPQQGPVRVFLHGIGSGSGSWANQLKAAQAIETAAFAWDAPGYSKSSPLGMEVNAANYAKAFWAWLDALNIAAPIQLVAHSLGAIVSAAAAAQQPQRIAKLYLLSPAQGYGKASPHERDAKRNGRLAMLANSGIEGIARDRSPHMLSKRATPAQLAFVREVMSQITPQGYSDATHLLANADLLSDLQAFIANRKDCTVNELITIASGDLDTIVSPEQCNTLASMLGLSRVSLGACGHVCAIEAANQVNELLGLVHADA